MLKIHEFVFKQNQNCLYARLRASVGSFPDFRDVQILSEEK